MDDAWLGFAGGVLATLVAALVGSLIQRASEKKKALDEAIRSVYSMLLELNEYYFWVASAELHKETPPVEAERRCYDLCQEIAQCLSQNDKLPHLQRIVRVLFDSSFKSANDRANELAHLIDELSGELSPRFTKHIQATSRANLLANLEPKQSSMAPGRWSPRLISSRASAVEQD